MKRVLSVVVPLLNEEDNILGLYQDLKEVFDKLVYFSSYELIFVNDGSRDNSLKILRELALYDPLVKIVSFTRNFGHEPATHAGIYHATGDAVVLIDCDRQDPAELILTFEQEYKVGYDIVYGQRSQRLNESWLKKLTSWLFYPLFQKLTNIDMPRNVGDFCLMSRKAINCFKTMPERSFFVRGLIYWSGLPKKAVPFVRRGRAAGNSNYNYWKLSIFALENIISFSNVPIYLIIFGSLVVITSCILGAFITLILKLFGCVIMTGWTSLMLCLLFFFASTFLILGILGLYISKIFQEIKQRPIYLIDEKINFE